MTLHDEILASCQPVQAPFELLVFWQSGRLAAVITCQVMVMIVEAVTQLQLVLPPNLQPLNDSYLLKHSD